MNTHRPNARALWLALALAGAPGAALLANTPEPTVDAALKEHRAVGQARLRVWGFEVYDASLWTAPGFDAQRYAEHRFGLELSYLRPFKGRDIAERSIDEMRGLANVSPAQAAQWLAAMSALFPDVQRGDRITGVHVPGSTAASSTPSSASPSRHATTRLRCASLPPSRAPQAWWATLTTLNAV